MENEGNILHLETDSLNIISEASSNEAQKTQKTQTITTSFRDQAIQDAISNLIHTPDNEPYAIIKRKNAQIAVHIQSSEFQQFVNKTAYEATGRPLNRQHIDDTIGLLAAKAMYEGTEKPVFLRIGKRDDGGIEVDLANDSGDVVLIQNGNWQISKPTLCFRRTARMKPLPEPTKGGSIDKLWKFINITTVRDQALMLAWLVGAFNPEGPYPILIMQASRGSGKTTAMQLIRNLIDPAEADKRALFKNEQDLYIAAENNWIMSYDNLDCLSGKQSDWLCRISTGGAFATRKLYSNKTESVMEACRPVIMNGIEDIASRADLISRSIQLTLSPISTDTAKSVNEIKSQFERDQPEILGFLLDCVADGLNGKDTVKLNQTPRMADFAQFVTSAERRLGLTDGYITKTLIERQLTEDQDSVAMDPIAAQLAVFLMRQPDQKWKGTMTKLLSAITPDKRPRNWPDTARYLSQRLRQMKTQLEDAGIFVDWKSGQSRLFIAEIVDQVCVSSVFCVSREDEGYAEFCVNDFECSDDCQ